MLMRSQIGQLFVIGFEGTELTPNLRSMLHDFHVGGVILFRRNIVDVQQVWELTGAIRAACPWPPPAVFVDEEGGPVSRLPEPVLRLPPMRAVGRTGDADLAMEIGRTIGLELRTLGLHVNLAPVVDVDTNPANPVIGARSFHSSPDVVARLGVALMEGLHEGGVTACPKHFPGHGDTSLDSHKVLPTLAHDRARLDAVELVPFHAVLAAGARMIMTAHVLLPALDPVHPATLSPVILPRLLREELGYRGIIITDDLEMGAITDRYTMAEAVTLGTAGATDMFIVSRREEFQWAALEGALRLAEVDPAARTRLAERAARVLAWKRTCLRRDGRASNPMAVNEVFLSDERRRLEERLAPLFESSAAPGEGAPA